MTSSVALEELPRIDRLRVRVLDGTLRMFGVQLRELPADLRSRVGLPDNETVEGWRTSARQLFAATVDRPDPLPATEQPKTLDVEGGQP